MESAGDNDGPTDELITKDGNEEEKGPLNAPQRDQQWSHQFSIPSSTLSFDKLATLAKPATSKSTKPKDRRIPWVGQTRTTPTRVGAPWSRNPRIVGTVCGRSRLWGRWAWTESWQMCSTGGPSPFCGTTASNPTANRWAWLTWTPTHPLMEKGCHEPSPTFFSERHT